jgi:hypothetical protein
LSCFHGLGCKWNQRVHSRHSSGFLQYEESGISFMVAPGRTENR